MVCWSSPLWLLGLVVVVVLCWSLFAFVLSSFVGPLYCLSFCEIGFDYIFGISQLVFWSSDIRNDDFNLITQNLWICGLLVSTTHISTESWLENKLLKCCINWEMHTPYAAAAEILIHINWNHNGKISNYFFLEKVHSNCQITCVVECMMLD